MNLYHTKFMHFDSQWEYSFEMLVQSLTYHVLSGGHQTLESNHLGATRLVFDTLEAQTLPQQTYATCCHFIIES